MKRQSKIVVLLLFLFLSACGDRDLQTLAKALDDTAHGVAILQNVVIEANAQNLISENATRSLLEFSVKVNLAGQDAVVLTRNLNSLGETDRQKLLQILSPVIQTIATGQTLAAAITDVNARQRVMAALSLIQASLNSANLVLVSR